MIVDIDLSRVTTPRDFHEVLAKALNFGPYYGHNLSALWDRITTDVPRPLTLMLRNAAACRAVLGVDFEKVVSLLEDASREPAGFVLQVVEGASPE